MAGGITDPHARGWSRYYIAAAQVKAGDVPGAVQAAKGIEDAAAGARSWIFSDIAAGQAKAGDITGALQTARKIEDARERAEVMASIAARFGQMVPFCFA